jgi:hypothetical protein
MVERIPVSARTNRNNRELLKGARTARARYQASSKAVAKFPKQNVIEPYERMASPPRPPYYFLGTENHAKCEDGPAFWFDSFSYSE